jgi:tetratricopeptide (TPR) repeat protein
MDLLALATALLANACRVAGKRPEADRHFEYVRSLITYQEVTDTEVLAQIDHLEGSLRMDQNRFKDAEKLLSRAAMLFSVAGEIVERARALITLGGMYFLQGELIRAIETTEAGLLELPGEQRYLYLGIPSESGHPFRREGGRHSDVKAATHSEAKAATVPTRRRPLFDDRRNGGRLAVGTSGEKGSDAVTFWAPKGDRCRQGDSVCGRSKRRCVCCWCAV